MRAEETKNRQLPEKFAGHIELGMQA